MIYSLVFIWAVFFSKFIPQNNKNISLIFLITLILLLPLLCVGGFRDISIGSDTQAYPVSAYYFVQQNNKLIDYFSTNIEALYLFTAYIVYHFISTDFSALLFVTNAIIICVFYIGLLNIRKGISFEVSILLFLCLFFNMFLSMQRQGLAMAFVFLGLTYMMKRKLLLTALCILVGFFYHKSAIVSVLCIPVLYYQKAIVNKYILIGVALFVAFFSVALNYFTTFDAFAKYDTYGKGGDYSEGAFSLSELVLRIVLLGVFWFGVEKKYKDNRYFSYLTFLLCDFMINLLQLKSAFVGRLGYYYYMCYIFIIPQYIFNRSINKHKFFYQLLVLFIVIVYWFFIFIYKDSGSTYPYKSVILNISD